MSEEQQNLAVSLGLNFLWAGATKVGSGVITPERHATVSEMLGHFSRLSFTFDAEQRHEEPLHSEIG